MILYVFMLIGAALSIGPWFAGDHLDLGAKIILTLVGTILLLLVSIVTVVTRLYRKASANLAFVRTGMGGAKVIKDGGTTVLPVVHQIIPVSLETMRLNVERRGTHALITRDNLRVDLSAEFYIKVQANTDDILQAARSLGARNVRSDEVSLLVQEKLVSALRTVAATKDLVELHSKRDEFASAVQAIVTHDLASNGLTLESVTISALDQTDPGQLQERNVFDAQGLRKIAEITEKARVERNEIERAAERSLVEMDVSTRKQVLEMQRDQAEFEAEQKMRVANVNSAREREVREFQIAQEELVASREIEKQKALQTAEVQRALAVEQAEINKRITMVAKLRDQETAEINKRQAVEVAERSKEVAVAEKEQERAAAQAAALATEAQRETASQQVLTVKVTAEAQREAEKKLIAAKQLINENKIREETEADVLAYMAVKQAEGERQAADLQYEARLRLAEGEAQAAIRRSDGAKAEKMVPVNVEREMVSVEEARAEVERQRLANKQEFDEAALKFELEKLRIDADRDVRIKTSEAMSKLMHGANVQIFGDPGTMSNMMQSFMRATGYGMAGDGLLRSLSPEARELLGRLGVNLGESLGMKNGNEKKAEGERLKAEGNTTNEEPNTEN
ncbi:MAG: flotillin family protein [Pirellulales bacterium]